MTARLSVGNRLIYCGCAVILIAYMSVTLVDVYKIWYFPTVGLCALATLLAATRQIRVTGLFRNMFLLVIYYLYLLLTAAWADRPDETIWWACVETVFAAVAGLFYLLSLNLTFEGVIDFFVNLVPVGVVIYVATYLFDPDASRLGGYVLTFAPFCLLFCALRLRRRFRLREATFAFACILMLLLSMSRTPLLAGGLGLFLLFLSTSESAKDRARLLMASALVSLLVYASILTVPQVAVFAGKSFARITGRDITVSGQFIEGEDRDEGRWNIYEDAKELYKDHWLLGIGYMNFQTWYGERYGIVNETSSGKRVVGMNLHNVFQTWALEGGIPCLIIVATMLSRYFLILWRLNRSSVSIEERSYYKALTIAMICILVEGLFHQVHEGPIFFILLGITFALPYRQRIAQRNAVQKRNPVIPYTRFSEQPLRERFS